LFHRAAKFFVLIAAVQILGGHWAVLQSVAWARMLVNYAQRDSLTVAVAKTFDGAHPCELCQTVSKGRQQEKQQDAVTSVMKVEAILASTAQLPPRAETPVIYFSNTPYGRVFAFAPPTPPPRPA
jgi:hypothetical protein